MSETSTSASRPGIPSGQPLPPATRVGWAVTQRINALHGLLTGSALGGTEAIRLLNELHTDITGLIDQNERLTDGLQVAQDQITVLNEEVRKLKLTSPYGIFLRKNDDGTAEIFLDGRKLRVKIGETVDADELSIGRGVRLDETFGVIEVAENELVGEVVTLQAVLADGKRARILDSSAQVHIVRLAEQLHGSRLNVDDSLLLERRSACAIERLMPEVGDFLAEEVPGIDYDNVGGLQVQIEQIREAVELPYLHSDLFERFHLRPPNGILLYGPRGCGKTMLAKAMVRSTARQVTARTGKAGNGHFLNIRVAQLLDKYVGETEKHIRLVFRRARELAEDGMPVIIFLDEMDSLFQIRRSKGPRGLEDTTVPQLLSEIDGVADYQNIIVVGASNREDLIDPALLRPGRFDLRIRVDRPNVEQASQILSKFLTTDIPINRADLSAHAGNAKETIADMVSRTIGYLYERDEHTRLFEITYANGDMEVLYFDDFNSGDTIHNIVERAKSAASKRYLESRNWGLSARDLLHAADEAIADIRDFATGITSDDVARLSGRRGERVVFVRTLARHGDLQASRSIQLEHRSFIEG
jgi:proteasome-associated ATPase